MPSDLLAGLDGVGMLVGRPCVVKERLCSVSAEVDRAGLRRAGGWRGGSGGKPGEAEWSRVVPGLEPGGTGW